MAVTINFLHCSAKFRGKMSIAKICCFHNSILQLKPGGYAMQCNAWPLQAIEYQKDGRPLLGTDGGNYE